MAAKNLNPEEMSQISEGWVDPQKKAHQALLAIPILNAQLPLIVSAHEGIQSILTPAEDPRIANIITIELAKDRRHDTIIRGSWDMLTAMADLIGGDVGESLITLRDLLIPGGLQSMLKSYRAESTQAKELRKAMKPEVRQRTDAIRIGEGTATLTDYLEEWIGLGVDLGDLEDEKGKLLASTSSEVSAAMILAARNQWVRVVNAMVSNADMVAVSDTDRALIFGPLIDAEAKADVRARGGSKPRAKTEEELAAEAKAAAEKAAAEKAAEKVAIEKAAAEKAAADKAAAEKAPKGPTS